MFVLGVGVGGVTLFLCALGLSSPYGVVTFRCRRVEGLTNIRVSCRHAT